MPNEPRAQAYMYCVLLPGDGRPAWGPGLDGRRAAEFAAATGCTLVRWPVQMAEISGEYPDHVVAWVNHG